MAALTEAQTAVVARALGMLDEAGSDVATAFNCVEADAIADAMSAVGIDPDLWLRYHAKGDDDGDAHRVCPDCEGRGRRSVAIGVGSGRLCPTCDGAGWLRQDAEV